MIDAANDIAIIGLAGRFPRSADAESFWRDLTQDQGSTKSSPRPAKRRLTRHRLERIDEFDAKFFDVPEDEALMIDPQFRIFLECAWRALEDAGCHPEEPGTSIAVFAGASPSTYLRLLQQHGNLTNRAELQNDRDFLATWTSYKLNLKGPSVGVQTFCSTSLVAVHLASQSLLSGECDVALAGGVSIDALGSGGYWSAEGEIVSPDGQCRPFDARANGTVFGDGIGVVVLKRLSDALRSGDRIRAVIKGSAVNNDGAEKMGFTAPGIDGQVRLVLQAQAVAGIPARSIGYVETHGTGTALGDAIEVRALRQAFREQTADRNFCVLGSLKGDIGHLDRAAGVCGLIRTALALEHRVLPGLVGFEKANPEIDFESSPFLVRRTSGNWEGASPRRAGVTALGVGGTNAHVILEEAPTPAPGGLGRGMELLIISAKDPNALSQVAKMLSDHLKGPGKEFALADIAHTLQTGRLPHVWRAAIVAHHHAEAATRLLRGDLVPQRAAPRAAFILGTDSFPTKFHSDLLSIPVFASRLRDCGEEVPELRENLERRELSDPSSRLAFRLAVADVWRSWAPRIGLPLHGVLSKILSGHLGFKKALAEFDVEPEKIETKAEAFTVGVDTVSLAELLSAVGRAWVAGLEIDWTAVRSGEVRRKVPLPGYPLTPKRYWPTGDDFPVLSLTWRRRVAPIPAPSLAPQFMIGAFESLDSASRALGGNSVQSAGWNDSNSLAAWLFNQPPGIPASLTFLWLTAENYSSALPCLEKALRAASQGPLQLTLVTRGAANVLGNEDLNREACLFLARSEHLASRFPSVKRRWIDLGIDEHAQNLARLLVSDFSGQPAIALRHGQIWEAERIAIRLTRNSAFNGETVVVIDPDDTVAVHLVQQASASQTRVVAFCTSEESARTAQQLIDQGLLVELANGNSIERLLAVLKSTAAKRVFDLRYACRGQNREPTQDIVWLERLAELKDVAGTVVTSLPDGEGSAVSAVVFAALADAAVQTRNRQSRNSWISVTCSNGAEVGAAELISRYAHGGCWHLATAPLTFRTGGPKLNEELADPPTDDPTQNLVRAAWIDVLKAPVPSNRIDFFSAGGDSTSAIQLLARLRERLGVALDIVEIFKHPTIERLAQHIHGLNSTRLRGISPEPSRQNGACDLTFGQERIWFLERWHGPSDLFNIVSYTRIRGSLNYSALEQAWNFLCGRHEMLRARFREHADTPRMEFAETSSATIPLVDLIGLSPKEALEAATEAADQEARRPFALDREVCRLLLIRQGPNDHLLLLAVHHLACDGWSLEVIGQELAEIYTAALANRPPRLRPVSFQYRELASAQRQKIQGAELERLESYWRSKLSGVSMAAAQPGPAHQLPSAGRISFHVPPEIVNRLEAIGRSTGATLFMVIAAAVKVLLHRRTDEDDVVLGTVVSGRGRPELDCVVGLFINTLILRTDLSGDPSFQETLVRVRTTVLEAYAHQDLPYEAVVNALELGRRTRGAEIFPCLLIFNNYPQPSLTTEGFQLEPAPMASGPAHHGLTVEMNSTAGALHGTIEFDINLYSSPDAESLSAAFQFLLRSIAGSPRTRVSRLSLGTTPAAIGSSTQPFEPIQRAILTFARQHPEAVAIVTKDGFLTYLELARRVDKVCGRLIAAGVARGDIVGLAMERSAHLIVTQLAVLEAGAAYLTIPSDYPTSRQEQILADAAPELIVSDRMEESVFTGRRYRHIDDLNSGVEKDLPTLQVDLSPRDAAYVIFTSGSTGRPKGVVVEHGGLWNLARVAGKVFGVEPGVAMLQFADVGWDTSVEEIYSCLASGGCLILRDETTSSSPEEFFLFCQRHSVQIVDLPTAFWHELVRWLQDQAQTWPPAIRTVVIGGESARSDLVDGWFHHVADGVRLLNTYGTTEGTAIATYCQLERKPRGRVPIGVALEGVDVLVLDSALQPVPVGFIGEVCIGGPAVARCYLGQPALTASVFVPDPRPTARGQRLFRTGDRGVQDATGNVYLIGRRDGLVKVRGHRVETGEIELALTRHPSVREAVVALSDGELVAHVVWKDSNTTTTSLRADLRSKLPEWSTPNRFRVWEFLPRTANDKLDRARLRQERGTPATEPAPDSRAPSTPEYELLAGIWSESLPNASLRADADFFDQGGHSLLAMRLTSRLRQVTGFEFSLRGFFEDPTLRGLVRTFDRNRTVELRMAEFIRAPQEACGGHLSFEQERLWFLDRLEPEAAIYNLPFGLQLPDGAHYDAVAQALEAVVERHELLRARVTESESGPSLVIDPPGSVPSPVVDLSGLPAERAMEEGWKIAAEFSRKPFQLTREWGFRVLLVRLDDRRSALAGCCHHLFADAWSFQILAQDFHKAYDASVAGEKVNGPPMPYRYADYVHWQRRSLGSERTQALLNYWLPKLANLIPSTLPTRRLIPTGLGASIVIPMAAQTVEAARALGRREGATFFMTLLAGFSALLHRWTGANDLVVGAPFANRGRRELESLVGLFVSTLVLRTQVHDRPTFRQHLQNVRTTCLEAIEHQDLPFDVLVSALNPERRRRSNPLFRVGFALNRADPASPRTDAMTPILIDGGTVKFDLSLGIIEAPDGVTAIFEYDTGLFDADDIRELAERFQRVLDSALLEPDRRINALNYITELEHARLLQSSLGKCVARQPDEGLHHLFLAQVNQTPDATAVIAEDGRWSYRELAHQAQKIASDLRQRGIGFEDLVGVMIGRTRDLPAVLLGILEAGAAFLPLDPASPPERLRLILKKAEPRIAITIPERTKVFTELGIPVADLDSIRSSKAVAVESSEPWSSGQQLAYVLFTSGSTGTPKGVATAHEPIANRIRWMNEAFPLEATDRVLHKTPLTFDVALWEVFWPLMAGATLVIGADGIQGDPRQLWQTIETQHITTVHFVPPMLDAFLEALPTKGGASLRRIMVSGEALGATVSKVCLQKLRARLINLYGPTEAAIDVTCQPIDQLDLDRPPSIGQPISNVSIYIMDPRLQLLPDGAPGEIWIGGIAPARGYLNEPGLTAEKFVPDPFSTVPGRRMYRTGDYGQRRADGSIEFLGRRDGQIKIRGQRIEIHEVEAALRQFENFQHAIVLPIGTGEARQLEAFIVPKGSGGPAPERLRSILSQYLQPAAIPSQFHWIETMPMTSHGKIDREKLRSLPRPAGTAKTRVVPRTAVEAEIADLWRQLLAVEEVGVFDDFFALGGHSLMLARLAVSLERHFGIPLTLAELFDHPTIDGITQLLAAAALERLDDHDSQVGSPNEGAESNQEMPSTPKT